MLRFLFLSLAMKSLDLCILYLLFLFSTSPPFSWERENKYLVEKKSIINILTFFRAARVVARRCSVSDLL